MAAPTLSTPDKMATMYAASQLKVAFDDKSEQVYDLGYQPFFVTGDMVSNGKGDLFVITENGYGKRTAVSEYPEHNRGGQGVFTIAMTSKKGKLVACRVVGPQHELMIISEDGVVIRVKSSDVSKLGRSTQGVKVMNMSSSDHVSAVARMVVHKKKAPKALDENQGMFDLAAAGAKDADEEEIETRLTWRDGTVWAMQNRQGVLVNGAPARTNASSAAW